MGIQEAFIQTNVENKTISFNNMKGRVFGILDMNNNIIVEGKAKSQKHILNYSEIPNGWYNLFVFKKAGDYRHLTLWIDSNNS